MIHHENFICLREKSLNYHRIARLTEKYIEGEQNGLKWDPPSTPLPIKQH